MIEVRRLRHFAMVAETLHFGRAAERLGMTQPPLSQSIIALERELGAALLVRTKRRVALTAFGAQWLGHVRSALDAVEGLPAIARRLRDGDTGRLELSFVSTADYGILPDLVRRYASRYPAVEIALTEATSDVQIAALVDGRGHAGIVIPPAGGAFPAALAYRRLATEPLLAAVPESWIASGQLALARGKIPPAAVIAAPLIVFPRPLAPAFYDCVMDYYNTHGGRVRIAQQAIQMQTIISLVSAGMGIALVPASLRHMARTGVRYVELHGPTPSVETGIAWRRDDTAPTLGRFLALATEAFAGAVPAPEQPRGKRSKGATRRRGSYPA